MIYILSEDEYSDYRIDDIIEVPAPLTKEDAAAFEKWSSESGVKPRGPYDTSTRASNLKAWLIAVKGARQVTYGELHDGKMSDYDGESQVHP